MKGLLEFLRDPLDIRENSQLIPKKRKLDTVIPKRFQLSIGASFINAGYWVALAAFCKSKPIEFDKIEFIYIKTREYASLVALEKALGEPYDYQNETKYNQLVRLKTPDDADKATKIINESIRNLFFTHTDSNFLNDLSTVVAGLHNNVCSHGKSIGFSMVQTWSKSKTSPDYEFEFAVADCGSGFLDELQRVGLPIYTDEEAINWCIEAGNSSKKIKEQPPLDTTHNPTNHSSLNENKHAGLGLTKLIELIRDYKGQLWLTSGEQTLIIDANGNRRFQKNFQCWQGVALACRFDSEKLNCNVEVTASMIRPLGENS